jgi:hypothetical protein
LSVRASIRGEVWTAGSIPSTPNAMISFFSRTSIREKGCSSLKLYFGARSPSPGKARSPPNSSSIASAPPATNRFTPSGASRMVPFKARSLQKAISSSRRPLSRSMRAKR